MCGIASPHSAARRRPGVRKGARSRWRSRWWRSPWWPARRRRRRRPRSGSRSRTRISLDLDRPVSFRSFAIQDPLRLVVDMPEVVWRLRADPPGKGVVAGERHGLFTPTTSRLVLDMRGPFTLVRQAIEPPVRGTHTYHLVLELEAQGPPPTAAPPPRAAPRSSRPAPRRGRSALLPVAAPLPAVTPPAGADDAPGGGRTAPDRAPHPSRAAAPARAGLPRPPPSRHPPRRPCRRRGPCGGSAAPAAGIAATVGAWARAVSGRGDRPFGGAAEAPSRPPRPTWRSSSRLRRRSSHPLGCRRSSSTPATAASIPAPSASTASRRRTSSSSSRARSATRSRPSGRYRAVLTRDGDSFLRAARPDRDRARGARRLLHLAARRRAAPRQHARRLGRTRSSETARTTRPSGWPAKENKADILGRHRPLGARRGGDQHPDRPRPARHQQPVDRLRRPAVRGAGRGDAAASTSNRRFAGFAVLKTPDMPSVLIELGYLSNPQDATNLSNRASA